VTDPIAGLNAALADRYVIDRELGRGGMATVYLARDLKHERFVALKTLRPEIAMALGRERFLREIKLAARLQHPNILAVYDSGDAGGVLYYVMPFVEGESLRERLEREPQLPLDDALQIAREVADALSYAHGHDVVHRDIKPENIMLSGGHAIVTDFGIARAVSAAGGDKLTETGLAIGTPAYMSPEQASGMGQVDRRSDIYSLGCVLYETLAGQPPFTGPTAQAIMARHSLDSVPRLRIVRAAIPDALEQVINRALEKVPADRYQTAAQFAEAMAVASTGRVSRVTGQPRRGVPVWRRPVVVGVGTVVVAGLAWLAFGRSGNAGPRGKLDPHRVAVLYFTDASSDSSLGYLADGLTEALIQDLRQVRALDVVSRSGVAPFRGAAVERDSIARALEAGTLVEGDVEHPGDRVRVTVRLVDGESGAYIQRGSFELPAGDQLAIRDSLAGQAAMFLREKLGPEIQLREERAGTKSVDAWTLVQRAERARKDAVRAFRADDRALAIARSAEADSLLAAAEGADARWAVPPALRGRVAYERSRFEREAVAADRFLQAGLAEAARALGLDARNADALELRGTIRYRRLELRLEPDARRADQLLAAAESDLVAATNANPAQVGAWNILSVLYYDKRDNVQANLAAQRAYEADAYLTAADQVLWRLYATSYDLEQFQAALDWCDKGRQRFPQNAKFLECRLWLMTTGARPADADEAWRLAGDIAAARPEPQRDYTRRLMQIVVASVLGKAGLADSARRVLVRARTAPDVDPARELVGYEAWVRTQLGDRDEALSLLREYILANPRHREGFRKRVHWWWRPLQNDPRFKALIGG
jgi:eukaryotic-like serine/threonine-protein kinase